MHWPYLKDYFATLDNLDTIWRTHWSNLDYLNYLENALVLLGVLSGLSEPNYLDYLNYLSSCTGKGDMLFKQAPLAGS